jgi:translation elongation factor EF-1alpha
MLTGASLAHAAILIVSAKEDERLKDETKLHLYLASLLGIKNLVVTINKIDTISYNEEIFNSIKEEMTKILKSFGYEKLSFVPVSARNGDNVMALSEATPWYKGKTVIEFMEEFSRIDYEKEIEELPARMFVQDIYDMGDEKILVGRLDTGKLRVGQEVAVEPLGVSTAIDEMKIRNDSVKEGRAGQNLGVMLKGDGMADVKRGNVCMPADSRAEPVKSINAKIFCLPGNEIKTGDELTITCASQEANAKISDIAEKMNPIVDSEPKKDVDDIAGWEAAEVKIEFNEPLVFESFSKLPHTGRFVLSKGGVVAVGVVI